MSSTNSNRPENIGILGIEIYFPKTYVAQEDLEKFDGVSTGKYTIGLGQTNMSFCGDREDIYSLSLNAVNNLIDKYNIDPHSIGRLEVGTETLIDKAKSIKTVLMDLFASSGNTSIDGIDTINACYGGTSALHNALQWIESSYWDGRNAIVVAGDIAVYEKGPARPTGGAGVVAMLIGPNAPITFENGLRGVHMENVYDFYKPDMNSEYPRVDGKLSISCYLRAIDHCYSRYRNVFERKFSPSKFDLSQVDYAIFHSPYNKLVQKSFARMLYNDFLKNPGLEKFKSLEPFIGLKPEETYFNVDLEKALVALSKEDYTSKVSPSTLLAKQLGNTYCGSTYSGLLSLFCEKGNELIGKRVLTFSYGSGLSASAFSFKCVEPIDHIVKKVDLKNRLEARHRVTPEVFTDKLELREQRHNLKNYTPSDYQGALDAEIQQNKKKLKPDAGKEADISVDANKPDETLKEFRETMKKEGESEADASSSTFSLPKTCTHEVLLPPDYVVEDPELYNPREPVKPARTYPFKLDPFQATSVACIERKESVLVSAHTSAGKTVVAEYSIAVALREGQRVIYTSPIKALSNQKFRDLQDSFQDVGLMTGDITLNPNASCLVMTTEILRSMLYRGSELMREVAWVIFDEIHYLRDKERGVVWEETIILLPDSVRFVFLSATIPNAKEFAAWIAKIHKQPCHVVYTEYRPIPLQHYIFPSGGDGLHLVVDEKGVFREENFLKSLGGLAVAEIGKKKTRGRGPKSGQSDCYKIVKMIMERNYQPVIVFSFSKKDCEFYALQMSKLDFNNDEEKKAIDSIFSNAIDSLSESDKNLTAVINILPLLKRGIGIHHAGLLPILKEIIEILFQYGYIKALFATETFSIGLNMPAKTVIFTNVRKFDGESNRWLTGGEYIQMSGRAGRRGLDERGIVILMVDEKMEPEVAKGMVKGQADRLTSSFWIGYSMLLNMMRVEDIDPEYLLKRSFHQYQQEAFVPQLASKCATLEQERDAIIIRDEQVVTEYLNLRIQLGKLRDGMRDFINQPSYVQPYLTPGRIVKVRDEAVEWGYGVILNFYKRAIKQQGITDQTFEIVVDVLLNTDATVVGAPKPCPAGMTGEPQIIPVSIKLFDGITSICLVIKKEMQQTELKTHLSKSLKETESRFKKDGGLPLIDPIEDMKITDANFKKLIRKIETLESRLVGTAGFSENDIDSRTEQLHKKLDIDKEVKTLKKQIRSGDEIILKDDLRAMKRILKRLEYISADDVVLVKGRVAAEISAGDELVISELLFMGLFNDLSIEQCVAVFSVFVFQHEGGDINNAKMKPDLAPLFRSIQDTARRVVQVSQECKLQIDEKEYLTKFNPVFMDLAFAWASGASFAEICKMTEAFEGGIIRSIRRLDELIRQMVIAAKSIGNTDLEVKFSNAIVKIKRDIPFAGSLYL
eukprot:gene193-231_t